jgi:hypothetical protein
MRASLLQISKLIDLIPVLCSLCVALQVYQLIYSGLEAYELIKCRLHLYHVHYSP